MTNLEKIVKELGERAAREDYEKRNAAGLKITSALYDKAAAYVNIIMAAGYAGFFTIWSNMKIYMSAFEMRLSALFMLFSILVFVMWEVIKMIHAANSLHGISNALQAPPAEFINKLTVQERETNANNVRIMRWWRPVLYLTIGPALVAASVLIYSFVINLLG